MWKGGGRWRPIKWVVSDLARIKQASKSQPKAIEIYLILKEILLYFFYYRDEQVDDHLMMTIMIIIKIIIRTKQFHHDNSDDRFWPIQFAADTRSFNLREKPREMQKLLTKSFWLYFSKLRCENLSKKKQNKWKTYNVFLPFPWFTRRIFSTCKI